MRHARLVFEHCGLGSPQVPNLIVWFRSAKCVLAVPISGTIRQDCGRSCFYSCYLPFSVSPPASQVIGAVITSNASWRCCVSGVMAWSVNLLPSQQPCPHLRGKFSETRATCPDCQASASTGLEHASVSAALSLRSHPAWLQLHGGWFPQSPLQRARFFLGGLSR